RADIYPANARYCQCVYQRSTDSSSIRDVFAPQCFGRISRVCDDFNTSPPPLPFGEENKTSKCYYPPSWNACSFVDPEPDCDSCLAGSSDWIFSQKIFYNKEEPSPFWHPCFVAQNRFTHRSFSFPCWHKAFANKFSGR